MNCHEGEGLVKKLVLFNQFTVSTNSLTLFAVLRFNSSISNLLHYYRMRQEIAHDFVIM